MKKWATSFRNLARTLPRPRCVPLRLAFFLWAGGVITGVFLLTDYGVRPAPDGSVPATWPLESLLAQSDSGMTAIMFVHPHCPCSAASIWELAQVMDQRPGNAAVHILFLWPENLPRSWVRTSLWDSAAEIPHAILREDAGGQEAVRFGVTTSGHMVIYNASGRLAFSGGITSARGHYGASTSREQMSRILRGGKGFVQTSVFGCPLHNIGSDCCRQEK